jgi:hypothetical protein
MLSTFRRIAIAATAALSIGVVFAASSSPASAAFRFGGGGFHGGGFHGGGFRGHGFGLGLGLGALGFAGAYGYGYGYPYYGDYAYNDYGYGYGDPGCLSVRRVYDRYGHYLGRATVNVCR